MAAISYRIAKDDADLQGILTLQQANLAQAVSTEEAAAQGFVTLEHDLPLLRAMNTDYGHSIAVVADTVVGYALMMQKHFDSQVSALEGLMTKLETATWNGRALASYRFFIMGQVCVDKTQRGKGVFARLYQHLAEHTKHDFDLIVTDIAMRNTRSRRAHEKVGFQELSTFFADDGHEWVIVALPI